VRIDLPPFTLIGATTRSGLITTPLRERFGIPLRLLFYNADELQLIVARGARVLGLEITDDGAREIARRARGTPRVAGRLLRRVRDFAAVAKVAAVDAAAADAALRRLEVDERGLDAMDRRYLSIIDENYDGGPVGADTLAAALPRGRVLTRSGYSYLGRDAPGRLAQLEMLMADGETSDDEVGP
jgi:Holliday junction DNA helicase RuvB